LQFNNFEMFGGAIELWLPGPGGSTIEQKYIAPGKGGSVLMAAAVSKHTGKPEPEQTCRES
jgi:hypothetical protein